MHLYSKFQQLVLYLLTDKSGAVVVEYAMTIAFFAIISASGMTLLGDSVAEFFSRISTTLYEAGEPLPPVSS